MVSHMKTTIEISTPILEEAKRLARQEGRTLREMVEEGLRAVVASRQSRPKFVLEDKSFKGQGLQEGIQEGSWADLRDRIYEGRGA